MCRATDGDNRLDLDETWRYRCTFDEADWPAWEFGGTVTNTVTAYGDWSNQPAWDNRLDLDETWRYRCTFDDADWPKWEPRGALTNTVTAYGDWSNQPAWHTDTYTLHAVGVTKDVKGDEGCSTGPTLCPLAADQPFYVELIDGDGNTVTRFLISENDPGKLWLRRGTWTLEETNLPFGYQALNPTVTFNAQSTDRVTFENLTPRLIFSEAVSGDLDGDQRSPQLIGALVSGWNTVTGFNSVATDGPGYQGDTFGLTLGPGLSVVSVGLVISNYSGVNNVAATFFTIPFADSLQQFPLNADGTYVFNFAPRVSVAMRKSPLVAG